MQDAVGRGARTSPVEGCGLLAGRTASRRRAGVKEKSCGPAAAFSLRPPQQERMENMQKNKVAVIMGSDSDLPVVEKAIQTLKEFGVPFEAHVMSAHRTPAAACDFAAHAAEKGFGVIIAAAGKAAHLGGVLAAHTVLPVIGIPMKSSTLDGLDALLATVQMPSGVPVATVAIDGAENAALLAIQILAVADENLAQKLLDKKKAMAESVAKKDQKLQETLNH